MLLFGVEWSHSTISCIKQPGNRVFRRSFLQRKKHLSGAMSLMSAHRLLPATDTTSDEWAPPTCTLRSVLRRRGGLRICVLLRMGNGREVPGTHHSAARQWLRAYHITLTLTLAATDRPSSPPTLPQPARGRREREGCMCGIPRSAGALPCTSQWLLYRPTLRQLARECRKRATLHVMAATPCVHARLAASTHVAPISAPDSLCPAPDSPTPTHRVDTRAGLDVPLTRAALQRPVLVLRFTRPGRFADSSPRRWCPP
ncbi:hypothetical protein B0H14DRAFT_3871212 [Mycena olivaceomarginata]|nr:hypothetical protein B0H14DRAFT_3871212 [Mycena olivaceomarginata]